MQAFASPTINDFLAQLQVQSERTLRNFQNQKNQISSRCAKMGATMGSAHALLLLDAVDEYVEKGVSILLGELRRALQHPELDAVELRSLVGPRLDELVNCIISASGIDRLKNALQNNNFANQIEQRLERTRSLTLFWLRQFDIGWDEPARPEPLPNPPQSR